MRKAGDVGAGGGSGEAGRDADGCPRDLVLRPVTDADVDVVTDLIAAQDVAWWGEPDADADDTRLEFDRVRLAWGSVEAGARLALLGTAPVGVAMVFDHGQTTLAVPPVSPDPGVVTHVLLDWLLDHGAESVDAPVGDAVRIGVIEQRGFARDRSSFELERSADVGDLGPTAWPHGYVSRPFRPGVDERELHEMIYSVWTDVPGHTHRPLEEWRTLLLSGPTFDPDLVVLARHRGDGAIVVDERGHDGPIAGVAICRRFGGGVGWVSQLAVGRDHRGVGLGRALLVDAFHRLAAQDGTSLLALGVEAENAAALGMYRSVGLDIAREYVHFSTDRTRAAAGAGHGTGPVT